MKSALTATFLITFALMSSAQNDQFTGRILDESDQPIVGATVKVLGQEKGAITGPKGYYELALPNGNYEIEVSSVGYSKSTHSLEVEPGKISEIRIKEAITALPEFVVETNSMTAGRQGISSIPGSVQYIDAAQLKEQNYTNINDILRRIPGVNLQEEDGFGLRPNIGLRGSGMERSSKITVMEDGILAAPAPYASPSAYYFPTAGRMSGVEVLKGSSQVRFGPFTTGGAINFLSTPIPNSLSGTASLIGGSYGFRNLHAHVGDRTENFGFVLESFMYGADGFKTVPNGSTGFNKSDLNAKISVNSSPDKEIYQSLTFSVGWTKEDSDETYLGLTQEDFNANPYRRYAASQMDNMAAEQNRLSLQHYIEIPRLFNVVTTVYRNDFARNWYKLQSVNGQSIASVLDDPEASSAEYDLMTGASDTNNGDLVLRANNRAYFSQGIQTTFDFEFETGKVSHDIHMSTRIHQDQEDRLQQEDGYGITNGVMSLVDAGARGSQANRIEDASAVASYLFYEMSIGKLSVTPGIRHEHVTISRQDFGKSDPDRNINEDYSTRSNFFAAWLPGIGVNYEINPKTTVFGGAHKGFAPGSSKEGSQPEVSLNYELGLRRSTPFFSGTAVVFLNDYENLLGADNLSAGGTGTGELYNAGEAVTKGLELEATIELVRNLKNLSLPITFAYTYTDARFDNTFESEFDGWGDVTKGDQVPYLARNQFFIGTSVKTGKVSVSLNGKYQSDVRTMPGSGDISDDNLIEGFFTADMGVNYQWSGSTSLFGSVTNLANNEYAVARRPAGLRPGMPRAFRLGINVNF